MKSKRFAVCLASVMVAANMVCALPMQAFAQGEVAPAAAVAAEDQNAPAVQPQGKYPTTVEELKTYWGKNVTVDTQNKTITLGEYHGSAVDVYIPGEVAGMQVYIEKLPGTRSDAPPNTRPEDLEKYATLTAEQAKIKSVTVVEVNHKKVKTNKPDYCKFGMGMTPEEAGKPYKDELAYVDLSGLDISTYTEFGNMFRNRKNLTTIVGMDNWDTSKITDMSFMFNGTKFSHVEQLKNWNLANVTDTTGMFHGTPIPSVEPLKNWNVSKLVKMGSMFSYCANVTDWSSISGWNVSSVKDMNNLFAGTKLADDSAFQNWDVSNVTNMYRMFANTSLQFVDLANWDVSKVINMGGMFNGSAITSVDSLANWDVSKVTDMSHMFADTSLQFADLSSWKIGEKTKVEGMFYSNAKAPLLVVSASKAFENYDFAKDNRTAVQPTFKFGDTTVGQPVPHFVVKTNDFETLGNEILQPQMDEALKEIPMTSDRRFAGWKSATTPSNAFELLSGTYIASFQSVLKQIQVHFVTEDGFVVMDTQMEVPGGTTSIDTADLTIVPEGYEVVKNGTVAVENNAITVVVRAIKTAEPETPVTPEKPAEPSAPVAPTQPVDPSKPVNPKTGDVTSLGMLSGMFATSAGALAVLLGKKKK